MPKSYTPDSTTTSRRLLLATAPTALTLSGAAIAAPTTLSPDATLIALCAKFDAVEHKFAAALLNLGRDAEEECLDAARDAAKDEQVPILDAITACHPTTLAGFAALVNTLALLDGELVKGDPTRGYTNERLMQVLFRGLMEGVAA